jgi:hypothetical protein
VFDEFHARSADVTEKVAFSIFAVLALERIN